MQEIWTKVDDYIEDIFIPTDDALEHTLKTCEEAKLPPISVTASQGKLLQILARLVNAHNILGIGTLGGYSTIFLARALAENGKVISLEINAKNAEIARSNIEYAKLADKVEIRLGKAIDSLAKIADENLAPFDLIFIDADKENNPIYFEWALKLARIGGIIIIDNIVRDGNILNSNASPSIKAIRKLNEMIKQEPRVSATAIQTVGKKGYDGFAIALVTS